MFELEEYTFIKETAKKDVAALNSKIESLVDELARLGKNLSDAKGVKKKLDSIICSIEKNESLPKSKLFNL